MEENNPILQNSTESPSMEAKKEGPGGKKVFVIILIIIVLGIVAGAAYFLGTKKQQDNSAEIVTETPTPTLFQEPSSSPTPSVASVSGTITPTKKPTSTPTITPTPLPKSKILSSTASLDGFESSNGGGNATLDIRAGENSTLVTRGFVSFDLSSLPAGASIVQATLRLYQAKISGSPYSSGGALKLDHLSFGDSLDNSDYSLPALLSSFITVTTNPVIEWKDVDVTDELKDDLSNGRSRSQYRLHFTTETTGGTTEDFTYFESAENTFNSGNTPQLVVKYY